MQGERERRVSTKTVSLQDAPFQGATLSLRAWAPCVLRYARTGRYHPSTKRYRPRRISMHTEARRERRCAPLFNGFGRRGKGSWCAKLQVSADAAVVSLTGWSAWAEYHQADFWAEASFDAYRGAKGEWTGGVPRVRRGCRESRGQRREARKTPRPPPRLTKRGCKKTG